MAIFRKMHVSFWSDSFVSELDKSKKLFYIYLLTNERTKQCGVYEITKRQISFDLGMSIKDVSELILYFISKKKIRYNVSTNEMALGNWLKYNSSTSPKVQSCINKEFASVKDTLLIQYVKSMDTQSQEEQEQEQEQEQPTYVESIDFDDFLKFINSSFKRKFRKISKSVQQSYKARLKEGYTCEDIQSAVNNAAKNKGHIDNNYQYCTPEFFSRSNTLDKYSDTTELKPEQEKPDNISQERWDNQKEFFAKNKPGQ